MLIICFLFLAYTVSADIEFHRLLASSFCTYNSAYPVTQNNVSIYEMPLLNKTIPAGTLCTWEYKNDNKALLRFEIRRLSVFFMCFTT